MAVRWRWIHSQRVDLVWYIGSALAGWLYIACVLWLGRGLDDPMRDPFYELHLGEHTFPLTLGLLVVASWAVLIDAPHVWATLARTFLDPDEWSERRGTLMMSLVWFAVGPIAVFGPYVVGTVFPLSTQSMALGSYVFFVFFRLWAYYHVVRQHWGFLVLYKRKNDDVVDPWENRADWWFFNATLYLPLIAFMASPWYGETALPDLGLQTPVYGELSVGQVLFPGAVAAFLAFVIGYAGFQIHRYLRGVPRNGPKLLLLAAIVPLHVAVFMHPLLALFIVPVVTVGHNLQYHRIVWTFGRNKYSENEDPGFRWARAAFRSVPIYVALGLVFTFALYRGPWVQSISRRVADAIDGWLVGGIGMVAGLAPSDGPTLGAQIAATFFLGWAMQHYYLDSKIWRVRKDVKLDKLISQR